MKDLFCANCGEKLLFQIKAVPSKGCTITVVAPHTCPEDIKMPTTKEIPREVPLTNPEQAHKVAETIQKTRNEVEDMFSGFPFMQHLKESTSKVELPTGPRDHRKPSREEISTTAPQGVIESVLMKKGKQSSTDPRESNTLEPDDFNTSDSEMEG